MSWSDWLPSWIVGSSKKSSFDLPGVSGGDEKNQAKQLTEEEIAAIKLAIQKRYREKLRAQGISVDEPQFSDSPSGELIVSPKRPLSWSLAGGAIWLFLGGVLLRRAVHPKANVLLKSYKYPRTYLFLGTCACLGMGFWTVSDAFVYVQPPPASTNIQSQTTAQKPESDETTKLFQ